MVLFGTNWACTFDERIIRRLDVKKNNHVLNITCAISETNVFLFFDRYCRMKENFPCEQVYVHICLRLRRVSTAYNLLSTPITAVEQMKIYCI